MGPEDNETIAENVAEYTSEEEADARNRAERVLNTALSFQVVFCFSRVWGLGFGIQQWKYT
jgi:hypothetical protein